MTSGSLPDEIYIYTLLSRSTCTSQLPREHMRCLQPSYMYVFFSVLPRSKVLLLVGLTSNPWQPSRYKLLPNTILKKIIQPTMLQVHIYKQFEYFRLVEASTKKPVMRYSHTAGDPIPHSQPQRSAFSRFAKQSMYQPRRFSEPERSQSAAAVQPGNKLTSLVFIKFRHFYSETNHISLHQTRTFQALLPTFEFKPLCRSWRKGIFRPVLELTIHHAI